MVDAQDDGFHPHPLAVGGHRQTLLGFWHRRKLRWTPPVEDVIVEAGDGIRLLLRASWQPGPHEARPALVTIHGLGGWDEASYGLATGAYAYGLGWHVLRMNMRGAGDSARICPRLYNAGLDTDLVAALQAVTRVAPRVAVIGFSLGANLSLLALGRSASGLPPGLLGVVAVSPPLDLAACVAALERPANRLYQSYFLRNLRLSYRWRQSLCPELYEAGRELKPRSIREWDEAITAPYGGYASADEYYARSSAGPYVSSLDRRVLILTAQDDPLVPAASVARWPLPPSGMVQREITKTGGHVGFVAPTRAPGRFWAAERAMRFLARDAGSTLPQDRL
jgi:predicted alpha/beta-fold hydrolase